jgi:hypothetical protein
MKVLSLVLGFAFFTGQEPSGCSAGSNVASAPDGGSSVDSRDTTCGTGHAFCDDFSSTATARSRFDAEELFSGSLDFAAAKDGGALTPASALFASTTPITTGTRTYARLRKDFTQTGKRFTLAFSERVDSACIKNGDSVESAVIGVRQNSYWVAIRHGRDSDAILEAGLANMSLVQSHVLPAQLPRDVWSRIVLDVDLEKKTVDLGVDGRRIVEAEPLKSAPGGLQAPTISVGILNDNLLAPPSACTVGIDDVVFDVVP